MSKRRKIYRVQFITRSRTWRVRGDGVDSFCMSKASAVYAATCEARMLWREDGRLTQVVIYKKNGRIQEERTYGRDPKRRPG